MKNSNYEDIYIRMNENDKEELRLLNIQHRADVICIISDIFSYRATLESIELVYSRYDNTADQIANPDIPAIKAALLLLIARLIYNQIGFIRYDHLYERKMRGGYEHSLKPNVDINLANIFKTIGSFYGLIAAIEIYNRDLQQPIFGI
ncbi:hypothetical protein H8S20_10015 [Clostridium sp. NSJ-6]|uniref:Uncharacterized protein n=1 Tax=Clostridium hominis TaxID=2763036 RepID=A0ABR7DCV4_9CLOT|nr:hypothetical protein [Clostridium hominis]MBC5629229.1 hypothetical protein [Clostridium hominis]MDU2671713.1 hypothetical protein [Clostridium sp.]